jgi:large subunit ribosomal protein L19
MNAATQFIHEQLTAKKQHPKFKAGDNVTVNYKIIEGGKERIQSFRGDVLKIQGMELLLRSQCVRYLMELVLKEHSLFSLPNVESVVLNKVGKVRRSKLYYLRSRSGKSARIKEKRM